MFAMLASLAFSQELRSPVLTIDSDRLYQESAFGQRVLQQVEARRSELAADNQKIQKELEAEEEALTKQRAELTPEAFRALADAFDARVQAIRRTREEESRAVAELLDKNRDRFLVSAAPVLQGIMRDTGAAVILERRSVFVSANAIDITDEAISRINAVLGDGSDER